MYSIINIPHCILDILVAVQNETWHGVVCYYTSLRPFETLQNMPAF
jgi:hypothetical protein